MAFPGVSSYTSNIGQNESNTVIFNYPSNIAAGDLILAFLYVGDSDQAETTPSGFTTLIDYHPTNQARFAIYYKVAAGGESGTFTKSDSGNGTYFDYSNIVYRITGYSGVPQISSRSEGTSASPDPSGLTITGGEAKDVMWIAFAAIASNNVPITSAPTNYTDNFITSGSSGTPYTGVACRNLNAQSEDPSSFGIGSSQGWQAITVAILPDPAAASSISPSVSPSASRSPSSSASRSMSPSASLSPSTSLSPSSSTSRSTSPSPSLSPSASLSPSVSMSPSASLSPSSSSSKSMSPSASWSPSSSTSPSSSSSTSLSPSASPSAPAWDDQDITLGTTFIKQTISFH